jgi:hypothetical protein
VGDARRRKMNMIARLAIAVFDDGVRRLVP